GMEPCGGVGDELLLGVLDGLSVEIRCVDDLLWVYAGFHCRVEGRLSLLPADLSWVFGVELLKAWMLGPLVRALEVPGTGRRWRWSWSWSRRSLIWAKWNFGLGQIRCFRRWFGGLV